MDRKKAIYSVSIGGTNITDRIAADVISIRVRRASGATADTAEIVLDDSEGHIIMPRRRAPVSIALGWEGAGTAVVFDGFVDDAPVSTGARGEGRLLTVKAKSADLATKIKQPEEKHKDDATLGDVMSEWAQAAGLSGARVAGPLASVRRDYWSMDAEHFIAWGQRIAREVGGTFKIMGTEAVLVPRSGGVTASGRPLTPIRAAWGENLIEWSLTPFRARPPHQKFDVRWYDREEAKHMRETVTAEARDVEAGAVDRFTMSDKDSAAARANATSVEGERESGGGQVIIDGNAAAEPEAPCNVVGARPGIDGTYRIDAVEDNADRAGGWTTTLELKEPAGTAGSDDR